MVVRHTRLGVREGFELFKRRDDVHKDSCLDVVLRLVVNDETMTYASASVMAAVYHRPFFAEDILHRFDQESANRSFIRLGGQR